MRIYYNNRCIYFGSNASEIINIEELNNVWIKRGAIQYEGLFEQFVASDFDNLLIEGDVSKTFPLFKEQFKLIHAGGGIVTNEADELLMIHRLGKWDLPKGKLDDGEDIMKCAQREVAEETGVQDISIKGSALLSYHIYNINEQWILKQTNWYNMEAPRQELVPQTEEDISTAVWVPKEEVKAKLENSYPNIVFLLSDYV